ncbi:short-chain dehydrogenase/reductase SDR [Anaeromyxobacter sp. Fw109-5]|nr:short-chain dehydrogenase/reductase SDR [Anaeromyxobacter sp. Fw109-5]
MDGPSEMGRRSFLEMAAAAAVAGVACRAEPGGRDREAGVSTRSRELAGKCCLVTGATSGMGAVTALELARLGATVVVSGRSAESCASQAEAIRRETGARVETAVADLGSLAQVRRMAAEVASRFERLDVLVNNAGTRLEQRSVTEDGLEKTFAVNYLSHFLLTNLLLDRLRASPAARVVNVASDAHALGKIELDNLQGERHYELMDAYARSKLAVVMFTYELSRRLEGTRVTVNAVHPGIVATNLGDENGFFQGWLRVRMRNLLKRSLLTPEEGARNIVRLASAPELEGVTARYFDQDREVRSTPASYDAALAKRLWEVSEALCASRPAAGAGSSQRAQPAATGSATAR